jgi:L-threonylcarbamoyladenylate synthase
MKNKFTNELVKEVSEALLDEEIVCFPTETVMGVAVVAENISTYNKLVDLKNRPANKVFPFCILKEDIDAYCEVNEFQRKIINKFLPGPLTVVLKRKEGVPTFIGNEEGTIAVRVSDNDFLMSVLRNIKKPIFLTSANLSGEDVCKDSEEAKQVFKDKVKVYVDGKPFGGIATTIVDLTKDKPILIRQGAIKIEDILSIWED